MRLRFWKPKTLFQPEPNTWWRGQGIIHGYDFIVLPRVQWYWPNSVAVRCWGYGWGGRVTFLPMEAFSDGSVVRDHSR